MGELVKIEEHLGEFYGDEFVESMDELVVADSELAVLAIQNSFESLESGEFTLIQMEGENGFTGVCKATMTGEVYPGKKLAIARVLNMDGGSLVSFAIVEYDMASEELRLIDFAPGSIQ